MKKFTIFFEAYGRKLKKQVVAKDEHEARMKILNDIKFHKVQFDGMANDDDTAFDFIKDFLKM